MRDRHRPTYPVRVKQTPDPATPVDQLSPEAVQAFSLEFLDAWNSHDPQRLLALTNQEVVWEDPFIDGGRLVGHDALEQWIRSIWRAMPDLAFETVGSLHLALDGRSVMSAWRGTGTMTGVLDPPGFSPTNQGVEMSGTDTHWFRDGRLIHVVTATDVMAVGRQIGAAPMAGTVSERVGVALQRLTARRLRSRAAKEK